MQITGESELMKNQKYAEVLSPAKTFDVLQTLDGDSLFFSIGTDNIFYVTREVTETQTGWTRVDLSTQISAMHGGAAIEVKTFALAQDPKTQMFDVAVVVTVSGTDLLYMSSHQNSAAADWSSGMTWTEVPFDAVGASAPNPFVISDIYLLSLADPEDASKPGTLTCFVDVIRNPTSSVQVIDRYYVLSSGLTRWVRHALPDNVQPGLIYSCLGRRSGDSIPGIYTLGAIEGTQELIYVPEYNFWDKNVQPLLSRLQLPPQVGAIGTAFNNSGCSNLFLAAASGLYVFGPDGQHEGASGTLVVPNNIVGGIDMFANITTLSAYTLGNKTVVWALGQQGQLFHMDCPAGEETSTSAWSTPVSFSTDVNQFAFFLSSASTQIVMFVYSGQDLFHYTQQHSGEWVKRNILLPPPDSTKYVEFTSFTTRIVLRDDYGSPVPFQNVDITSEVPVSVYINDTYRLLSPTTTVTAESDGAGSVTVIQATDSLGAVRLTASIQGPATISSTIDPLANVDSKLQSVKTGDDLASVQITAEDGSQKPLIPSNISSDTRDSAAQAITQLMQAKASMNAKSQSKTTANKTPSPTATAPLHRSQSPSGASTSASPVPTESFQVTAVDSIVQGIKVAAEDLFQFFKHAAHAVSEYIVHCVNDTWHFIAKIGESVYHAVLDTLVAVTNAIEFVLRKLEVAFEDLVRWLGFIFGWQDIVRCHNFIKSFTKAQIRSSTDAIDTASATLINFLADGEDLLNKWADVTDPGVTIGSQRKNAPIAPGSDSPQAHWGIYHMQNGTSSAQSNLGEQPEGDMANVESILSDLETLFSDEMDDFKTAAGQILTQVIEHIYDLTPVQALQKILAIIGDLILKSAKEMITAVADLGKLIAERTFNMLDSSIDIPILSQIYKLITGDDLTILDLVCFVGAIPATIMFKVATGKAPFPDDASVQSCIQGLSPQFVINPSTNPVPSQSTANTVSFMQISPQYAVEKGFSSTTAELPNLAFEPTTQGERQISETPTADQPQSSSDDKVLIIATTILDFLTIFSGPAPLTGFITRHQ
ncbi:putative RNA-directed DNA polymerase from transposon X-element [Fusarium sp. NRRL 52700]|nr:putative RNA-directed DNA polymerase from transposon X-element [Fusarium sp. NRRL 52700]